MDFPLGPRLFGMCEFSKGDEILCVRIMHGKSNKRFFQEAISTSSGCVTGFILCSIKSIVGIFGLSRIYKSCSDGLAHARTGMGLKTVVEHFPGQSIQTNSVPEPSSPRTGPWESGVTQTEPFELGFFSMWKPCIVNIFSLQSRSDILMEKSPNAIWKFTSEHMQSP